MERKDSSSSSASSTDSSAASTATSSTSIASSIGGGLGEQKNDHSLYSNLYQSQIALRRLQASSKSVHPLIADLLRSLDERIAFCLPVCSGDAKKLYTYILDILDKLRSAYDNRLALYFNRSPYWQHYQMNMIEILATLAACCTTSRTMTKNGRPSGVEFRRKFIPMAEVMRRRLNNSVSRPMPVNWRKQNISIVANV